MSLTRKMLKEMGIGDISIEKIIAAHTQTLEGVEKLREDSKRLEEANSELERLRALLSEDWEGKYRSLSEEYESYKKGVADAALKEKRVSLLTGLMRECGVLEECIAPITEISSLEAIGFSEDGEPLEVESIKQEIMSKWAAFIPKTVTVGLTVADPPKEPGEKVFTREDLKRMTPREINQNYDKIVEDLRHI